MVGIGGRSQEATGLQLVFRLVLQKRNMKFERKGGRTRARTDYLITNNRLPLSDEKNVDVHIKCQELLVYWLRNLAEASDLECTPSFE